MNGPGGSPVACVAIGNPRSSFEELSEIARLATARTRAPGAEAIITAGRAALARAHAAGVVEALERFGVSLVTDTCWGMMEEPVIPPAPACC